MSAPSASVPFAIGPSHRLAQMRFSQPQVAAQYPSAYGTKRQDRRESSTILQALRYIPARAEVLDLPCGTGRLTRLLSEQRYRVTGADVSAEMVARARANYRDWKSPTKARAPEVRFEVCDVMATQFDTDRFDAIICNRLFHHFTEAATRQSALTELNRISKGPIIVSFFNSFALDAARFWVKHACRRTRPLDRIPISLETFRRDIAASGLRVSAKIAKHWGISPMWYLVLAAA